MDERGQFLRDWGKYIVEAARGGQLTGKPCDITRVEGIVGPRAGALEMRAGLASDKMVNVLGRNNAATLRQFVPWDFLGDPTAYMSGRNVRVEAGWPDALAEKMVRLTDLGKYPMKEGRWVVGKNEHGTTIVVGLNDRTPHFLVSGATGSGKSVALRSAALQLSRDETNSMILIDGKYGESLKQIKHLPGVVGPLVMDVNGARSALGWACSEMRERYRSGSNGRLVVIFDEIQQFADDSVVSGLMKKLATQGRGAGVHLIAATQHPTVRCFGDAATRRQLSGKVALRVSDPDASRVAVGGNMPRADFLLGAGDCYTVAPGACHRVQGAYVDARDFGQHEPGNGHQIDQWPAYEAENAGQELPRAQVPGRPRKAITYQEIGVALVSAWLSEGRPALKRRLVREGLPQPGSDRARNLLTMGRQLYKFLSERDFCLTRCDKDDQDWELTETD
jgi:hypothetical protein